MPVFVLVAVLFSALLHAAWNAGLRYSHDRSLTVAWIGASSALVSIPFALRLGFPQDAWWYVIGSSTLHLIYLYLLAQAYKLSELSFAYPIARGSSPALVAVGGYVFASEKLSGFQWLGIVLIAVGILAIGLDQKVWDRRGLLLAVFIGIVIATYTVVDALGARASSSSAQYNSWEFSIYGLGIALGNLSFKGIKSMSGDHAAIRLGMIGGLASVLAYAIVVWGMVHSSMGPVSGVRETSTLFATVIAVVVLKESFTRSKVLGSISIVAGALLVALV